MARYNQSFFGTVFSYLVKRRYKVLALIAFIIILSFGGVLAFKNAEISKWIMARQTDVTISSQSGSSSQENNIISELFSNINSEISSSASSSASDSSSGSSISASSASSSSSTAKTPAPTQNPTSNPTSAPTPPPAPTPSPTPAPTPTPANEDLYNLMIMGDNRVSASQMATYLLNHNSNPLINCSALELCELFISKGDAEGVRGDIAFCQSIIETNWFKFTGDVNPDQNNYAGLGATGGGVEGEHYDCPATGVLAQIQHLKAYGSTLPLNLPKVDTRYDYVVPKGKAPKWTDLSGKWAVPGYHAPYTSLEEAIAAHADYGSTILNKYADLKAST